MPFNLNHVITQQTAENEGKYLFIVEYFCEYDHRSQAKLQKNSALYK